MKTAIDYGKLGRKVRRDIIDMVRHAGRGHIASGFSLVEILLVLYHEILKVDPKNPDWPDRDRMILSKGHGCMALYSVLSDLGFFDREHLWEFCGAKAILGSHPDHHKIPGLEASTGSLGHGPSLGVGMALAARMDGRPTRVYVLVGDGECNEGSVWEAALSASKHGLDNLTILVDHNKQQSYGFITEVLPLAPFIDKWRAFGFDVLEADMGRPKELADALRSPWPKERPRVVICHTIKGKGVSFIERDLSWHHKRNLKDEELKAIFKELKD